MAAENERFITEPLAHNDQFLRDLQLFLDSPTPVLRIIADKAGAGTPSVVDESEMEELRANFSAQPQDLQRIAAVLSYLKQRLIDTERDPTEAVYEIQTILGRDDLTEDRMKEIAGVLSYSQKELEEYFAVSAFSVGPAFAGMRLMPSLLPAPRAGASLVGGYYWTISYMSAEGESRSITMGITPGELEFLETTISQARELLETMKGSVRSSSEDED